jgi:PhnB protein
MKSVNPYLYFAGNTEEAFNFYKSVFGGEFLMVLRYRDFPGNSMGVAEGELDRIAHIGLPLGEADVLMGTDAVGDQALTMGTNIHLTIEPESAEEAERLFAALSAGGRVAMPLHRTEWAEKHGACVDRFGIQWMLDYTGNVEFSGAPAS